MTRGDVVEFRPPRRSRGHEQRGKRYAVVVQSSLMSAYSTVIVAPTSSGAPEASFRPSVRVRSRSTLVMTDMLRAVDPGRLGKRVGRLSADELGEVDAALRVVLGL